MGQGTPRPPQVPAPGPLPRRTAPRSDRQGPQTRPAQAVLTRTRDPPPPPRGPSTPARRLRRRPARLPRIATAVSILPTAAPARTRRFHLPDRRLPTSHPPAPARTAAPPPDQPPPPPPRFAPSPLLLVPPHPDQERPVPFPVLARTTRSAGPDPAVAASVPGRAEQAGYFAGNLGNIMLSTTISSFLLIYLTDVIGLAAGAVGVLLLVVRIVDAAVDPLAGYLLDHLPETRKGRFRSYLTGGGVIGAASFAALFLGPAWLPAPLAFAWVLYLLWGVAFPMMDIPLNALLPAITADPRARGRLAGIKGFTYLFGTMLVTAITLPIVDLFPSQRLGWQIYVGGLAVLSACLTALAARGVRERVRPLRADRYTPRELLRIFASGRTVPVLLTAKVATSAATGALLAAMPFYFTYNVGDKSMITVAALVMTVPMIAGSATAPLLGRRTGLKPVYLAALAISAAGVGIVLLAPYDSMAAILGGLAVAGLGLGMALTLNYALLAELTDYAEWAHGHRAEGGLASLASFAAKAGGGLGAGLTAYLLSRSGYVAGAEQTATALDGIRYAQAAVPLALALIGALVFLAYPLTPRLAARVATDLAARRATATTPH
ncbi:MFS transporter [Streptomyces sp. DSM 41014]|uniref:MFS transporter n=1 Tax=Streptomyces hintoniae TaxID=3075521 RepID=A0ABU2UKK7_9ACTN|nr:MFS transporter [Streptomyces sp. DSM 41014]MDT0473792.1 MFS transporter [Streptomyces sp. DSM 41014]